MAPVHRSHVGHERSHPLCPEETNSPVQSAETKALADGVVRYISLVYSSQMFQRKHVPSVNGKRGLYCTYMRIHWIHQWRSLWTQRVKVAPYGEPYLVWKSSELYFQLRLVVAPSSV
jgi:hypothetical protein